MTPKGLLSLSGVSMPCGYVPEGDESFDNMDLVIDAVNVHDDLVELLEMIYGMPELQLPAKVWRKVIDTKALLDASKEGGKP